MQAQQHKMSALTTRQRTELNNAVVDFLSSKLAFAATLENFRREAGIPTSTALPITSKGALEKKWNTVVALNDSIVELEEKVAVLAAIEKRNTELAAAAAADPANKR